MNKNIVPSGVPASLGDGVVRPFLDKRKSPNVLYLGDCVNGARITEFVRTPSKEWIHAECEGGIFTSTFSGFLHGA